MREIFIFGTCRVCVLIHEDIKLIKEIRHWHSRCYGIGDDIHIYTEPVNYTTKLIDVLDNILYMKGKLYSEMDPKRDTMLQSIFFRGHKTIDDCISPYTHPSLCSNNENLEFSKIIIEVSSIKQYIINTRKYGDEFYLKNLPYKIDTKFNHNNVFFDKEDFICKKMSKEECFQTLDRIKEEVNCKMLIIGPYISKTAPDYVNSERADTQDILKEYCMLNDAEYFDLSEAIKLNEVEIVESDDIHLTVSGVDIINHVIHKFIKG